MPLSCAPLLCPSLVPLYCAPLLCPSIVLYTTEISVGHHDLGGWDITTEISGTSRLKSVWDITLAARFYANFTLFVKEEHTKFKFKFSSRNIMRETRLCANCLQEHTCSLYYIALRQEHTCELKRLITIKCGENWKYWQYCGQRWRTPVMQNPSASSVPSQVCPVKAHRFTKFRQITEVKIKGKGYSY